MPSALSPPTGKKKNSSTSPGNRWKIFKVQQDVSRKQNIAQKQETLQPQKQQSKTETHEVEEIEVNGSVL